MACGCPDGPLMDLVSRSNCTDRHMLGTPIHAWYPTHPPSLSVPTHLHDRSFHASPPARRLPLPRPVPHLPRTGPGRGLWKIRSLCTFWTGFYNSQNMVSIIFQQAHLSKLMTLGSVPASAKYLGHPNQHKSKRACQLADKPAEQKQRCNRTGTHGRWQAR